MTKKLALRMWYDEEGFDYNGGGEYFRTGSKWFYFSSESELLEYLQDNICDEGEVKPVRLKTIKEYVDTYGFEVWEKNV